MGICCTIHTLSPEQLARVRADPPLVWRLLEPEDEACYFAQRTADQPLSLLQRLFGRRRPRAETPSVLPDVPAQPPYELDLDKSWDGLRHCVGLCAPDAPDFFAGDGPIGRFEVGYGPALAVDSLTLARYAAALAGLSEAQLVQQFQSSDFEDVYLRDLWRRRDADALDYLLENFRDLQAFLQQGAAQGRAAVLRYS